MRHIRGLALIALAIGLAPSFAPAALAQDMADPNVRATDIPMQPLRDLNIDGEDIPPLLVQLAIDPYSSAGLTDCTAIASAIADVDSMLGDDIDLPVDKSDVQKGANSVGRVAASFVGGLIPFRGIVRELTGASAQARRTRAIVTAAMIRRGFLKGIGLERGCAWPARPADVRAEFTAALEEAERQAEDAEKDAKKAEKDGEAKQDAGADIDPASAQPVSGPVFVSQPVVQGTK